MNILILKALNNHEVQEATQVAQKSGAMPTF